MNKLLIRLLFNCLVLLLLMNCENKSKQDAKVEITIFEDSVVNQMQAGIGINFTSMTDSLPVVQLNKQYRSYGGSCWGANPPLSDTASWSKIWKYADWMGLDFCRLLTTRKAFEPEKGNFTFESAEMKMLYNYLDYCQLRGIDVFIQNFANNVKWLSVPTAGNDPVKILRSAPNNLEDYTNGLMKLLDYLVNKKKYSCIKYISITNEPFENWSWYIAKFDPDSFASPVPAFKLMHEKLAKSNLGIKLSGPDVSVYYSTKIHPEKSTFFNHFDAYDIHSYVTRPDWYPDSTMTFEDGGKGELNKISLTLKQLGEWKNHAKKNGNKPLIISEMGSFMYGFGEDTVGMSTFDAMLKDVESVIRYSNIGLDGFMRWSFLNRGNLDGQWQSINTWDANKNNFLSPDAIKPHSVPYYTWGLLTRFTPKNALILKTETKGGILDNCQRVFAATYKSSSSNNYSTYIINDSEQDFKLNLNNTFTKQHTKLYQYQLTKTELNGKTNEELALQPTEILNLETLKLLPKSITVISTYNLNTTQKGIIE